MDFNYLKDPKLIWIVFILFLILEETTNNSITHNILIAGAAILFPIFFIGLYWFMMVPFYAVALIEDPYYRLPLIVDKAIAYIIGAILWAVFIILPVIGIVRVIFF